jgi:protein-disulfide isomerase
MGKQDRDRSRALRQAQAAIDAQRGKKRTWVFAAGGAIIAVLVVAIVVGLVNAATSPAGGGTAAGAIVKPAGATADGALTVGDSDARVRLEVFVDYMCPFCGRFEHANGGEMVRLVRDGTVRLELHPLSFLDKASAGSEYSTRAANAVATVADRAPDQLLAFHKALFDRQPAEGTSGLSDAEIAALARDAGVPDPVVDAFAGRHFVPWVAASTTAAFDGGISGTPTVRINGTAFTGELYSAGGLTQAVTAAAARAR